MKKWMAMLLALAMTLCAAGAMAENPPERPFEVTKEGGVLATINQDYEWTKPEFNGPNLVTPGVLTIKASGLTISMAGGSASTNARIEVQSGVTNVTLAGVQIDTSIKSGAAMTVSGNTTVILAAGKENMLKSSSGYAGLQKNVEGKDDDGLLVITCALAQGDKNHVCSDSKESGCGRLTANGGSLSAGIGGGYGSGNGSGITISGGVIVANGGMNGAGIGGGKEGNGTGITITGGVVTATGGTGTANGGGGAGIGGGSGASGSDITISGGTVTANGIGGAGIGGGKGRNGTGITISGGVVTANSDGGAGIGGGAGFIVQSVFSGGNGTNITISGGTVTAKSEQADAVGNGYLAEGASSVTILGSAIMKIEASAGTDVSGDDAKPIEGSPFMSDSGNIYEKLLAGKHYFKTVGTAIPAASLPQTGDASMLGAWAALLGASAAGAAGMRLRRNKRK